MHRASAEALGQREDPVGDPGRGRGRVYVVIVHFGPVRDTLECLESVMRLRYHDFRVIVCDNGSTPESLAQLGAWAAGELEPAPAGPVGRRLAWPPVRKPVEFAVIGPDDVARGSAAPLTIVASPRNRGFAGGNNLGLRCAMADPQARYFWLLNNDTAVEPNALGALVARMADEPKIGLCGSTLAYYADPDRLQARGGGTYDRWLGRTRLAGLDEPRCRAAPPVALDYVHGASMLVRRRFIETIGLLDESYFLYFEELDWAARAAGRFALGYAADSLVFHKEGGSAGSDTRRPERRSALSDYHGIRSRLIYTRRHHPAALPTVWLGLLGVIVNRARRGQWDRIPGFLRLMTGAGRV